MGIPITTSPSGHGLNQGMQRLAEPEGEPAGGARFGGSSRVSEPWSPAAPATWRGERPGVEGLDPPVMEARWHFGAAQGSSGGGPEEVAVPGGAGSLPQPSSPLPFSLHRVAMPAFSYSNPVLPLPQHTASRGAAGAPRPEGPWAPQGCWGLGHGPRGQGHGAPRAGGAGGRGWHLRLGTSSTSRGVLGRRCALGWLLVTPPATVPCLGAHPAAPRYFPGEPMRPLPCRRGTSAELGGNSAWLRRLWDKSETCCWLRLTCAKPPSHARRAASY